MDTNTRTARGRSARFTLVGGARGFLAAVGVAGLLAGSAAGQPKAAGLLPPRPLGPGETPPVARAAMDDGPTVGTTPVNRGASLRDPASPGPAWLNGTDTNVVPAGATNSHVVGNRLPVGAAVAPPRMNQPVIREEQSALGRGMEKIKGAFGGNDRPNVPSPTPVNGPSDPSGAFRGTNSNGAPVFAGPPAYRWYGYGGVTPGANPYAPTGQYPKASANWYSVTGATPGAFPVPVMNPLRSPPGAEPPTYAVVPPSRTPGPVLTNPPPPPMVNTHPVAPTVSAPPRVEREPSPNNGTKFELVPPSSPEPPRLMTPPKPEAGPFPLSPVATAIQPNTPPGPVAPLPVPSLAPPPELGPLGPIAPQPIPMNPIEPTAAEPLQPPAGLIPALDPVAPITATKPAMTPRATPDDIRWQPTTEPLRPPEGTWVPIDARQQNRRPTAPVNPVAQLVARGQIADTAPKADPVADVVRALCKGRATEVDVRWTGPTRVTVCFETRTEPEATRLVKDISARPELAPLQIDFCVLVK